MARYRLLHMSSYISFYALVFVSGTFLFLVFCDRVASIRMPLPRGMPVTTMNPGELRLGLLGKLLEELCYPRHSAQEKIILHPLHIGSNHTARANPVPIFPPQPIFFYLSLKIK